MCEELLVNPVHLDKVIHGSQKDIDLDDLGERAACCFEDGGEVLDAEFGHLGDCGGGLGEDFASWRARDLAGAVDCGGGCDCVGLD